VFYIIILPHELVYNKRRILFELVFRTAAIVQFKDVNGHFKFEVNINCILVYLAKSSSKFPALLDLSFIECKY